MSDHFRRARVIFVATLVGATTTLSAVAHAQGEPPARVGRLAFTQGTVSFHDSEQTNWSPAAINTPLTSGDAIWTEPNARSEVSVAGTRVRMDGATQLDVLALDDSQTRLQLAQGRIDVKALAMEKGEPYQIVTPRGTISLQEQGDYYVEAGSTQDPTRLGVRAGAAQIESLNGQVLAVRPGEVGEVLGDAGALQLRTVRSAPPAPAAAWASRDRQVIYEQPPQYLSAGVTGYEDLNANGTWVNDPSYGQVWTPRAVPAGWAPYRTGRWVYQRPWGWTWVDEQPWGFAPYHYGRWANANNRWVWVPPQRETRPVYAPALVAFIGGVELAVSLGNHNNGPVGWFPLGPREVYVPPYSRNRDYYQRINQSAQVENRILEERWVRAERREAYVEGQNSVLKKLVNQRYATVVPSRDFVRSTPVTRAALKVAPEKLELAPVARVAAPPAPTASIEKADKDATSEKNKPAPNNAEKPDAKAKAEARGKDQAREDGLTVDRTAAADMPTLGKPAAVEKQKANAPGPKVAATEPKAATSDKPADDKGKQAVPALAPRHGPAPPELKGAITPAPDQPGKPGEPAKERQAAPQPQAKPEQGKPEPAKPAAEPSKQEAAPAPRPGAKSEPATPVEPSKREAAPQPQAKPEQAKPEQAKPAEPPKREAAPQPQAKPEQQGKPEQAKPAEPPKPQAAPAPQAAPEQRQPQQAKPVEPPKPQAAPAPHPAPPPQQAKPVEPPKPATPPAPKPDQQGRATPPVAAPPPAAPPPQPPQQVQRPAPPPQPQQAPQPPARPAPQQTQAPAPPPQAHPAPQQAQTPAPQQQQQQQARPAPQAQNDKKGDDKK